MATIAAMITLTVAFVMILQVVASAIVIRMINAIMMVTATLTLLAAIQAMKTI